MELPSSTAYALYIASALGAVSLYLASPRKKTNLGHIASILGAMTLGGLWLTIARSMPDKLSLPTGASPYYYLFSAIAIFAAVKVITNKKPVMAALWFVMVILASSGLLLVLTAGFIAFALIIIYGGAILITYLFVIMLAGQAGDPAGHDQLPEYETTSREPAVAIASGFLLLAILLSVSFTPIQPNPNAAALTDQQIIDSHLQDRATDKLLEQLTLEQLNTPAADSAVPAIADKQNLSNIERVGMNLFEQNPLGLELAGIILLVALIGSVTIARTKISDENQPLTSTESNPD